jgi:hypothetical protein
LKVISMPDAALMKSRAERTRLEVSASKKRATDRSRPRVDRSSATAYGLPPEVTVPLIGPWTLVR